MNRIIYADDTSFYAPRQQRSASNFNVFIVLITAEPVSHRCTIRIQEEHVTHVLFRLKHPLTLHKACYTSLSLATKRDSTASHVGSGRLHLSCVLSKADGGPRPVRAWEIHGRGASLTPRGHLSALPQIDLRQSTAVGVPLNDPTVDRVRVDPRSFI